MTADRPSAGLFERLTWLFHLADEVHALKQARNAVPHPKMTKARTPKAKPLLLFKQQPMKTMTKSHVKSQKPTLFASIAAGKPTRADLLKAHQTVQAAIGKVPSHEIAEMDVKLRALAHGRLL